MSNKESPHGVRLVPRKRIGQHSRNGYFSDLEDGTSLHVELVIRDQLMRSYCRAFFSLILRIFSGALLLEWSSSIFDAFLLSK